MDKEFLKWLDSELETRRSDYAFLEGEESGSQRAIRVGLEVSALQEVKEQVSLALYREAME